MSTKRTDVIIRTQINILSVFDNIYIFLSRVNHGGGGGAAKCLCLRWSALQMATAHDTVRWRFQGHVSHGRRQSRTERKKTVVFFKLTEPLQAGSGSTRGERRICSRGLGLRPSRDPDTAPQLRLGEGGGGQKERHWSLLRLSKAAILVRP